eukprot:TRINITY_DN4404_c2_g1_i1.p3 TRINITY_DN4404_c2_g1~~TRINITY_DN4404_c2_g1_i1.p3  ORF type:complete len:111 (+),score=17.44 TRINITY_DN4404_c2_g1_i1:42-335(+)
MYEKFLQQQIALQMNEINSKNQQQEEELQCFLSQQDFQKLKDTKLLQQMHEYLSSLQDLHQGLFQKSVFLRKKFDELSELMDNADEHFNELIKKGRV